VKVANMDAGVQLQGRVGRNHHRLSTSALSMNVDGGKGHACEPTPRRKRRIRKASRPYVSAYGS
jgi:hypothetical protein